VGEAAAQEDGQGAVGGEVNLCYSEAVFGGGLPPSSLFSGVDMSPVLSLSDVGYRQFGLLPSSGGGLDPKQVAVTTAQCGDYEAAGPWVRRRVRKKGGLLIESFQLIDILDKDADLTDKRLAFVDDYFNSEFANSGVPRLTTESENLLRLVESAASEERRCLGMYRLEQALAYAGPQRLRPVLRDHVLPCFFKLYPEGKVVVIRYNPENDNAAALMRTMYTAAQTPLQAVTGVERSEHAGN
jgi:hypothetical protein